MTTRFTNLVYLFSGQPPRHTVENPWFIQLGQDYRVEMWDIAPILFAGLPRVNYGEKVADRSTTVATLNDFRDLLLKRDRRGTVVVFNDTLVHCRLNTERVVREIVANRFEYVLRDVTNSFSPSSDLNWTKSRIQRFKRKSILGFRNRRAWFWSSVKPPLFALVASRIREDWFKICGLRTRFIRVHSRDYEHYLVRTSRAATVAGKNVGVYLDGAFAGCSDDVYDNRQTGLNIEEYYGRVGRFLQKLGEQAKLDGCELALHPCNNVDPELIRQILGIKSCNVTKGKTVELVQCSSLVASECSSAFGQAVLFDKPVSLFCPASPSELREEKFIIDFARALGRRVNYAETTQIDFGLNEKAHRKFCNRYVKEPDTPKLSEFQILDRALNEYARPTGAPPQFFVKRANLSQP